MSNLPKMIMKIAIISLAVCFSAALVWQAIQINHLHEQNSQLATNIFALKIELDQTIATNRVELANLSGEWRTNLTGELAVSKLNPVEEILKWNADLASKTSVEIVSDRLDSLKDQVKDDESTVRDLSRKQSDDYIECLRLMQK